MLPFNVFGLKNFRIFCDEEGFFETFSAINILTGANNSGKSSLIKSLQMLKNSIKENKFPFDLDLTDQEHLLGDFDNLLFNKEKREIEISLPFTYLGITKFHITMLFVVLPSKAAYKAHLRTIKVVDQSDEGILFSFSYHEASEEEKVASHKHFDDELENYNREKKEIQEGQETIFADYQFLFPPQENQLVGYIEWRIHFDKLKSYLVELKKFYRQYLEKGSTWKPIEEVDKIMEESGLTPSLLIKSFKNDVPIASWDDFIEKQLGDKLVIEGKEHIGENEFESDDYYFSPPPAIEHIFYWNVLKILKANLKWTGSDKEETTYSIIENSFETSWQVLINRISTINYVSTTKEENLRIYNAAANTQFIKLLKNYENVREDKFVKKYLKAFEIGKEILIDYQPKYQLMSVSIITLKGENRDLVDFGYGIKQIIVFLIQISVLAEKNKRTEHGHDDDGEFTKDVYDPSVLLIEEPESNLHPKWQSLLGEMFVEANKNFNIQLIIETHSEYLIRKFQTLVANREADGKSIKIFYLRNLQKLSAGKRQVDSTTIHDDGSINYKTFDSGFFDESDKLELSLLNIQRERFLNDFEELKQTHQEDEEKIVQLQQKIDDFTSQLDIDVYTHIIDGRFDTSKLDSLTLKYLISGQFLLHNIAESGDFSPVIIQYGRAIENEVKAKLFANVNATRKWMLGPMQGSLEKFKTGTTQSNSCSQIEFSHLIMELSNRFFTPFNLKIDLLDSLRTTRNLAGHSGLTQTKPEAENYIQIANDFLDTWIVEMQK